MKEGVSTDMKYRQLILGFVLLLFLGLAYVWSIFVHPLEEAFSWTRDQTSMVFTVYMVVNLLAGVAGSRILKRAGLKRSIALGTALSVCGFFLTSCITAYWQLVLCYSLLVGFSVGMLYNIVITTVNSWFKAGVGLSSGILLMGFGLGSFLLAPPLARALEVLGWRNTFRFLGLIFALLMGAGIFLLKDGKMEEAPSDFSPREETLQVSPGQMLKAPAFYLLCVWGISVQSIGLSAVNHAAQMADEAGTPAAFLPLSVSLLSAGNGLARLFFGYLYDRIGRRMTMWLDTGIGGTGVLLLNIGLSARAWPLVFLSLFFIGVSFGGPPPINSSFARKRFGDENYGTNFSLILAGQIPAPFIGGILIGELVLLLGSYSIAVRGLFVCVFAAMLALIMLGKKE